LFKNFRALDLDDFRNICDCEEYPLLRTINRVLRNYPGPHNNCLLESKAHKPTAEETTRKPTTQRTTQRPISTKRTTTKTTQKPLYEGEEEEAVDDNQYDFDEGKSCTGRTFLQHDTECNMYYICDNGKPVEQRFAKHFK
jgi:chitinase